MDAILGALLALLAERSVCAPLASDPGGDNVWWPNSL